MTEAKAFPRNDTYHTLEELAKKEREQRVEASLAQMSSFIDGCAGAVSSCLCALVFYPLENLRTRKQVAFKQSSTTPKNQTQ